jgi:DNA-binding Lrp family transcriptional regulator
MQSVPVPANPVCQVSPLPYPLAIGRLEKARMAMKNSIEIIGVDFLSIRIIMRQGLKDWKNKIYLQRICEIVPKIGGDRPLWIEVLCVLDRLDIQILRQLYQGEPLYPFRPELRIPFKKLARRFDVSEGTVRNRVGRMLASGILRGFSVLANPTLVGLYMGAFGLDVSNALKKDDVINKLKLIDGIWAIQNHHGSFLGLMFVYEDEENLLKRLDLFTKIAEGNNGIFSRLLFPASNISLDRRDWKLLLRLMTATFKTYGKLAKDVGISVRTLKRRISKILNSAAVFTWPNVSLKAVKNAVAADLMVTFTARSKAERAIMQLVDDFAFYIGTSWEGFGYYGLILPNAASATEILQKVESFEGVKSARMEFVDEHFEQPEALLKYVESRASKVI